MSNIELKWIKNGDERTLEAQDITTKIEIDEKNKEIKNAKEFFREIIFMNYYKDWDKKIELISNEKVEIGKVKMLINELITICNTELEKAKEVEDEDL